jgi:hypothetical protein
LTLGGREHVHRSDENLGVHEMKTLSVVQPFIVFLGQVKRWWRGGFS